MNPLPRIAACFLLLQASVHGGAFQPRFSQPKSSAAATTASPTPILETSLTPQVTTQSVLRVNSTNQAYDYQSPWQKKTPYGRRGIGVLISGGRILTTADLVANSNFIELEKSATAEKSTATVERIDYECNLAILRPSNAEFLDGMSPLALEIGRAHV